MSKNPVSPSLKRVAILVETTRTYTRDILAGVRRYMQQRGTWSSFIELRAFDSPIPSWLEHWDGDGILTRTNSQEMADLIVSTGVPAVELRTSHFNPQVPMVGVDNESIGQMVAEHFINRGYRRFAAYSVKTESYFRQRLQNFVRVVESVGEHCHILTAQSERSPENWEEHQQQLIDWVVSLKKPIGIFATTDQMGVRLLDACHRAGVAVPDEVAVVSCENDSTLCGFSSPTLTSVRQDGHSVGYKAAEVLDDLMHGRAAPSEPILFPPLGIEVRESSDEFVIEDALILRAVKLIRTQALKGISVAELCDTLSVSRSTLDRRMKSSLHRGAKDEILRIRFREVQRLLTHTDHTIEVIAEMTGINHAHYLQSSFRERFGMTPGDYRKSTKTIFPKR